MIDKTTNLYYENEFALDFFPIFNHDHACSDDDDACMHNDDGHDNDDVDDGDGHDDDDDNAQHWYHSANISYIHDDDDDDDDGDGEMVITIFLDKGLHEPLVFFLLLFSFKNKLQLNLGYSATSYPDISIIQLRSCSINIYSSFIST